MTDLIHIGVHSVGLDDLSRKQQRDPETVLAVLRLEKCFSVFDATATRTIAKTMDALIDSGRITTVTGQYPWTYVTHIDGVEI